MITSEKIDMLSAALAKAQGEMNPALKDSTNPHFKSKYADLSSAWLAAQGPVTRNGLAVVQGFEPGPEKSLLIKTRLIHSSGQWVESTLPFYPLDQKPQTLGSCITYGRRYSLMAILGIVPDDDDDGNAAARVGVPKLETFDVKNEAHKTGFKELMETRFPDVPKTLYRSLAEACQGAEANNDVLSKIIVNNLQKADRSLKIPNGMMQSLIERLEATGQSTAKVTGKTPMEILDMQDGPALNMIVKKIQAAMG
jgi:hypothetical protein